MSIPVKLSSELVSSAKIAAETAVRSVPKQIEYWAKVGKIADENPNLPLALVKDILTAQAEINSGEFTEYQFG
ncbi:MAG: TA system antitoxin ParD family protein [Ostreibacterium sp.]